MKKFKILFAAAGEKPAKLIERAKALGVDIAIATSSSVTTSWYAMTDEVATALQDLKFTSLQSTLHPYVFMQFETIEKIKVRLQENEAFEIVE